jgi:hypothetical protein
MLCTPQRQRPLSPTPRVAPPMLQASNHFVTLCAPWWPNQFFLFAAPKTNRPPRSAPLRADRGSESRSTSFPARARQDRLAAGDTHSACSGSPPCAPELLCVIRRQHSGPSRVRGRTVPRFTLLQVSAFRSPCAVNLLCELLQTPSRIESSVRGRESSFERTP